MDAVSQVYLRPYQLRDVECLYEAVMESKAELKPWLPWCHEHYSRQDSQSWVESQVKAFPEGSEYAFVIVDGNGRLLGGCGLNHVDRHDRRANLGYWVRRTALRRGVAIRAARQLADWAFANTEFERLEILVSVENVASLAVARRLGATREGILRRRLQLNGRFHDAATFALLREPPADGGTKSDVDGRVGLRRCQAGDEQALALVGQASFLEAFAGTLVSSDIQLHCQKQHAPEKYASWLLDPDSCIWLLEAEPGRAPVGYLVLTKPELPLEDLKPTDLEIKRVYLLHRFQNGGHGARLMREAETEARQRGCRRLLLGVYSKNDSAISFYERLGYRKIGHRRFKVGENTYDDYILGLDL